MSPPSGWPFAPGAAGAPSGRRVQYAALPYRVRRDGEVQIRLITSRETRRWVIPKGWPIKGLTPPKTAAREAYEEAGLVGVVSREPMGLYTYEKRLGTRSVLCDVLVFPLKVKRLLQKWPERFQRYGFWFSVETAAAAVQEEDLSELILSFGAVMARRWEEKQRKAGAPGARARQERATASGGEGPKPVAKAAKGADKDKAAALAPVAVAAEAGASETVAAKSKGAKLKLGKGKAPAQAGPVPQDRVPAEADTGVAAGPDAPRAAKSNVAKSREAKSSAAKSPAIKFKVTKPKSPKHKSAAADTAPEDQAAGIRANGPRGGKKGGSPKAGGPKAKRKPGSPDPEGAAT